jgi:hypothetical protein
MQSLPALDHQPDGGSGAGHPQLATYIRQVPFDRRGGDAQLGGDLIGLPMLGDAREASAFLGRQQLEQGHVGRSGDSRKIDVTRLPSRFSGSASDESRAAAAG